MACLFFGVRVRCVGCEVTSVLPGFFGWVFRVLLVVIVWGLRSVSFPNLVAKSCCADGTAWGTVWESRWLPAFVFGVLCEGLLLFWGWFSHNTFLFSGLVLLVSGDYPGLCCACYSYHYSQK